MTHAHCARAAGSATINSAVNTRDGHNKVHE
jgi:hypothetical protein